MTLPRNPPAAALATTAAQIILVAKDAIDMKRPAATFESLQSLPASVVILDASGTIVAVNDAWKDFGRRNGLHVPHSGIGSNYLHFCRSNDPQGRRLTRQLKALLAGRLDLLTSFYPCHSPTEQRWFSLIGLPLSLDRPAGVALMHVNLTDLLPRATGARRPLARAHARSKMNFEAISGAIEHSVSDALSSQLGAMLAGSRSDVARQDQARAETDEMVLARAKLSKRQMEILRLLGEGKTNKEMARTLLLSPNTVKLHVSAILHRLNLKSRTHAALLSSRLNQQNPDDFTGSDLTVWKKMRTAA